MGLQSEQFAVPFEARQITIHLLTVSSTKKERRVYLYPTASCVVGETKGSSCQQS